MSPRRYFGWVLGTVLALIAAAWGLAWWLQPLYGDLTRIGGHAERAFGWNTPMEEFHPLASTFGEWTQPVDVLVIGDSFANLRPHQQWQNWLAARTGWRIHTLDKHKVEIETLVAGSLYRQHPPRVVIWNSVERDLFDEYAEQSDRCTQPDPTIHVDPLDRQPRDIRPIGISRPQSMDSLNPGFARVWLWRNLPRRMFGLETSETRVFPLARSDLFSASAADRLLMFDRDLRNKQRWHGRDNGRIRCSFARLARLFEASGATRFVTALAPDKSSAYRPWLKDPAALPEGRLAELLEGFPVPDARLDRAVASALKAGMPDVYMPDDTHWGTAGHKLAADAILVLLLEIGLAK